MTLHEPQSVSRSRRRRAIAVFAHNESRRIMSCLEAIRRSPLSPDTTCYVLANGCTDDTVARAEDYARSAPWVKVIDLKIGDKSATWNHFIHDVAPKADNYFFVDGDCEIEPGALQCLEEALCNDKTVNAASGVPAARKWSLGLFRRTIVTHGGLAGNLYALSGDFVARLREMQIRLPRGLIGDDSIVSALVAWDLDRSKGWKRDRLRVVDSATFRYESIGKVSLSDPMFYIRRLRRYSLRHYQNQLIRNRVPATGLPPLPDSIETLYLDAKAAELTPRRDLRHYFFDRWATRMIRDVRVTTARKNVDCAARPAQPRILFVTPVSPFSLRSGVEQRSTLMHDAFAKIGEVDTIQLMSGAKQELSCREVNGRRHVVAQLRAKDFRLNRYAPKSGVTRLIERSLGKALHDYDLVVGRHLWPICQLDIPEEIPAMVDLDDFRYRYGAHSRPDAKVMFERATKAIAETFRQRQLARFDAAFFTSERDREIAPAILSEVLPNIPAKIPASPRFDGGGQAFLFVGALWYRPNAEGVDWFLSRVWPTVLGAFPHARLTLVGAAPAERRRQWEKHRNVQAPGFVNDLAEAYAGCSAAIVPIHSGGGSNIKVLEALAHGRPCVTTGFTHAPFSDRLRGGRDLFVADTEQEFADQCIRTLSDPLHAAAVAQSGHDAVRQHYTQDRFDEIVARLAKKLL